MSTHAENTGPKRKEKLRGLEGQPGKIRRPQHTELMRDGREYPDPTPVAPPVGFIKQPTLAETMKQMVRSEALRRAAQESGMETFEEADDFDVGDDYDPRSPYEEQFDPPTVETREQAEQRFVDSLATGLRKAFTEEAPKQPAKPPEKPAEAQTPPKEGGDSPPPTNPLTSFFSKTS